MIFILNNKEYTAPTAVGIIRAIERDTAGYPSAGASIRQFLSWSLRQFADRIHARELESSPHVSEEALAFNYLCLLDEYHIGILPEKRMPEKISAK